MLEVFDAPLFKRLAHNDTGQAAGHQGGIVIPKDLDKYFPQLARKTSPSSPTVDVRIDAALFVNGIQVGIADVRYQYQTWGGTRSPERRLTDNLAPLRGKAKADDFLLIERGIADPLAYRLRLYTSKHPLYAKLEAQVGKERWGVLNASRLPVAETDVERFEEEQASRELAPFEMFDKSAAMIEARGIRIARARAFRNRVTEAYGRTCAVCGASFVAVSGASETEAAHIVPRGLKGADDVRNGLALCRSHHWAFDRGLWAITDTRTVVLNPAAAAISANKALLTFAGSVIRLPATKSFYPDANALRWHRENIARL